jgi:hypothetical protein
MAAEEHFQNYPRRPGAFENLFSRCTTDRRGQALGTSISHGTSLPVFAALSPMARAEKVSRLIGNNAGFPRLARIDEPRRTWLTAFALCLATSPESLVDWSAGRMRTGVEGLLEHSDLVRIARGLVLALEQKPIGTGSDAWWPASWEWGS